VSRFTKWLGVLPADIDFTGPWAIFGRDSQTPKSKILQRGSVDPRLKAWCQGSLGDKTFQQISEEFAELVVPRVWEREGRNVSRVATRLSISPKKVRRILTHVGRRKPYRTIT